MSETIIFHCPNCSTELNVSAELAGVSGPCPNCYTTISAPVDSESIEGKNDPHEDHTTTSSQDPHLTPAAHPSTRQRFENWKEPVKNALIGFLSVTTLAAATWWIAKAIEKSKEKDSDLAGIPVQRVASETPPLNTPTDKKPVVIISKDGKVVDGDTVFPIKNTVKPLPIDLSSIPGASIAPPVAAGSVIDQNSVKFSQRSGDVPKPSATNFVAQSENEKMMLECRNLINDFLAAETLEERLPMIFSERVPTAEIPKTFANSLLDAPIDMAKTITKSPVIYFGYEGPNTQGIAQQYFLFTLAPREGETTPRIITVHLANHQDGKYRINADAFVFSAENKLDHFVNNPKAAPLIAYLFLERCHFSFEADAKDPPSGTFNVRLLGSPIDQSSTTAVVKAISKTGAVLDPVVKWGVPPRAAIVEIKHATTPSGQDFITIDRVLKLNWLQSYQTSIRSDE